MSACAGDPGAPIVGGGGGGGGGCIQDGDAQGEVAFWDEATQCYVPTTAPADGDIFVYDAGSGLLVPRAPLHSGFWDWGNLSVTSGTSFMAPGVNSSSSPAPNDVVSMPYFAMFNMIITAFSIRHGSPVAGGNITYEVDVNGVPSGVIIVQSSTVMGPTTVTPSLAVPANATVVVRLTSGVTITNVRTRGEMTWREVA